MGSPFRRWVRARCCIATLVVIGVVALASCRRSGLPHHYDDPSAMIAVFEADSRDAWQLPDRVIRSIPIPSKSAIIADIGAGSGYFTRRLAAEVPEGKVYAVDVDSAFERHVSSHRESWGAPNIEPHLAHYEDPMLPSGEIDMIFTANTYSFIRDRRAYFQKVHATLKPGGTLVVLDFRIDARPPPDVAPEPQHRVARDVALSELKDAGFSLVKEETFLPHQYFFILKRD